MERTQPQEIHSPLLQGNKLLHYINYLGSIKNTFYGGAVYHGSKILFFLVLNSSNPMYSPPAPLYFVKRGANFPYFIYLLKY
jgi:hypothetical protein